MKGNFGLVNPRDFFPCPQYYQASNAFSWVKIICEMKIIMYLDFGRSPYLRTTQKFIWIVLSHTMTGDSISHEVLVFSTNVNIKGFCCGCCATVVTHRLLLLAPEPNTSWDISVRRGGHIWKVSFCCRPEQREILNKMLSTILLWKHLSQQSQNKYNT